MRQMISSIGSSPQPLTRAAGEAVKMQQRQQVAQAAPEVAMIGVPGEPDYKKGLTGAFTQLMPIHQRIGNSVVGGIAYNTNSLSWRDYNPGFFDGLYAPQGEYSSKPFYYTDLAAAAGDPSQIKTAGADELPVYGETATPTPSQARPASTQVVQGTDTL